MSESAGVRNTSTSTRLTRPPPTLSTTPMPQRVSPGSTPKTLTVNATVIEGTLIERMFGSLAARTRGSA